MSYTRIFEKPYEDGYKDKPFETTPVTASTLNDKDDALEHIEDYLENAIVANPVLEGTEDSLTSIGIEGTNYKIEGGGGGGIESDIIASNYDAETTYNAGQYCFYNDTIWRCKVTSAGETPEEGDFWTEVVVMDEVETAMNSGGDANIWYGTHAEYEEEKATIEDGTQVCFTDDVGLEAGSEYYSETEQIVGTYMGKPLYRGYFNYGALPSDNFGAFVYKNHGISNIDKITNLSGIVTFADGNQTRLPYTTTTASATIGMIANSTQVGIMVGQDRHTASAYFFLEYTKTTDSVVGVINGIRCGDNYSTTERVIGTWIDGKPLYQKTFDFGALPNSALKDVAHGIANVAMIWVYDGFCYQPNGDYFAQLINTAPVSGTADNKGEWYFGCSSTYIRCLTAQDRSNYSAYVTLRYTKTTD